MIAAIVLIITIIMIVIIRAFSFCSFAYSWHKVSQRDSTRFTWFSFWVAIVEFVMLAVFFHPHVI